MSTTSSRTPEGWPSRCPLCGAIVNLEYSDPGGDAPCPKCGCLLLESSRQLELFRTLFADQLGVDSGEIDADTSLVDDLGADSLDTVELVMELEEEFDLDIPAQDTKRVRTIGDVIRLLQNRRIDGSEP